MRNRQESKIMFSAADLRKGLKIEVDGHPYVITEYNFMKPGKGQAIYTCRIKSMIDGSTQVKQYRSNDKIDKPQLTEKKLVYSYKEADDYVFMDENYEQVHLSEQVMGTQRYFLKEEIEVEVLFHNGQAIGIELPVFVERRIEYTEPGARGNTATNVMKPAKVEGGYELPVPLFVNEGDMIRIDTRTGEYAERVR
jgi:elongation factor P